MKGSSPLSIIPVIPLPGACVVSTVFPADKKEVALSNDLLHGIHHVTYFKALWVKPPHIKGPLGVESRLPHTLFPTDAINIDNSNEFRAQRE